MNVFTSSLTNSVSIKVASWNAAGSRHPVCRCNIRFSQFQNAYRPADLVNKAHSTSITNVGQQNTRRRYDRKTYCRPFYVRPPKECSNTRTELQAAMHCDISGFWLNWKITFNNKHLNCVILYSQPIQYMHSARFHLITVRSVHETTLHNKCTNHRSHRHVWSLTVATFQRSRDASEWSDRQEKWVREVSSVALAAEYTTVFKCRHR